jgi:hypothetical protein
MSRELSVRGGRFFDAAEMASFRFAERIATD